MGFPAGRLRHRIDIEQRIETQDQTSGDVSPPEWIIFEKCIPAEFVPLSVNEFIAAAAKESQIKARITIRRLCGLTPDMRIKYRGVYYDPQGFLADANSGREYISIPVSESADQTP